ncbi:hypothetical protein CC85DRAFT_183691 [Cutaneotrichosporon oleaginosum]|uniref:Uncharacterized protein n=1 Tax=Cutaneotrichosporon oleaginosum TaxID=879819 RepID=A0A0J0XEX9_9TREE|nr:uncharacterized protein CC85DRAFT_183691 [Cutaneotrichosporon oleaginosum]KLT39620.1 hypothetical protein CC85DRAFT_183691 [Cutaneotrichosporon oleaginosum]TXT05640.1 hypothetical protein COLE_06960 [Cutaneotrichosporon oleaginosum]
MTPCVRRPAQTRLNPTRRRVTVSVSCEPDHVARVDRDSYVCAHVSLHKRLRYSYTLHVITSSMRCRRRPAFQLVRSVRSGRSVAALTLRHLGTSALGRLSTPLRCPIRSGDVPVTSPTPSEMDVGHDVRTSMFQRPVEVSFCSSHSSVMNNMLYIVPHKH